MTFKTSDIFGIILLILMLALLTGCSHTTEITTNTIDTLTVVRPEWTESVPIKPLVPGGQLLIRPDTSTQKEPRVYKGETQKHKVVIDLDTQTAEVTDKPDTTLVPFVSKQVEVINEPTFFEQSKYYLLAVIIIIGLGFGYKVFK